MSAVITGLPPDPILERRSLIQLRASQRLARRTLQSRIVLIAMGAGVAIALVPLFSVLIVLVSKGAHYLDWSFLTSVPQLPSLLHLNAVGGISNAIVATLVIDLLAGAVATPIGVILGLFLSETTSRTGGALRAMVETMTGLPSVLLGVFAYEFLVTRMKTYTGMAAAVALAILMVPVIAKAAELAFTAVPKTLKEAALALGARESRVARKVIVPTALPGVITGVLLAFARAVGETAPVLLVAGPTISTLVNANPLHPMTPLPLLIYGYSYSQYPSLRSTAWGVALALVILVFLFTTTSRLVSRRMRRERRS